VFDLDIDPLVKVLPKFRRIERVHLWGKFHSEFYSNLNPDRLGGLGITDLKIKLR
jgi:hypothetical protein